jgi:acetyl/propionyl-CoA carboxylase alpha subunit/acetyl-CoA carboxylase carboxyltransferase component
VAEAIRRIAVMNRGEAATRCFRAIRELRAEEGVELIGIALYTDPDRSAPFVREADEAIALGPALRGSERPRLAYLDQDRVLAALRASRTEAVWPGWGFLAEDASFVERLEAAGLIFLGPRSETVRMLGDKVLAKRLAESADIPVPAWTDDAVDLPAAQRAAERIGYPLMIKASAGGGGRGIRRVTKAADLPAAFASARTEARSAFGDGRLFLERCIEAGRHVEVQIAADQHGGVLALGLRDCSVQRNHQKVIEEAPPPGLPASLMTAMREASVRIARKANYVGVGTCEYLVTHEREFLFLEVNPRLQVEHGITEELTGFDLVKWQIRIARGDVLPERAPEERGWAIEARVCAEDPANGFLPSPGRIELLELPAGPGIRVDAGIAAKGSVPSEFDSMVAKVIARGATRDEARARLERAVGDLRVVMQDGMVNKGFLLDLLGHPDFRAGRYDTRWLERSGIAAAPTPRIEAPVVAAILGYQAERAVARREFFQQAGRGRPRQTPPSSGREVNLVYAGGRYRFLVYHTGEGTYRVHSGARVSSVSLSELAPYTLQLNMGGRRSVVLYSESAAELRIELDGRLHRVQRDLGGQVRAPAPALVIEVAVEPGARVAAGQRLALLEAMKTETAVFSPLAGVVRGVSVRAGERVAAGDVLLVIEPGSGREEPAEPASPPLELEPEADPLDLFFDEQGTASFAATSEKTPAARAAAVSALRTEIRRLLLGYDVNPQRAERAIAALQASLRGISTAMRAELSLLAFGVDLFTDVERLFSRVPSRSERNELGPSNDARMAMYLRRIDLEGAGLDTPFLDDLRQALRHFDVDSLRPTDELMRAVLRLCATRTTPELRERLISALLRLLIQLGQLGETFARFPELERTLDALVTLRGAVLPGVADLAAQVRYLQFERPLARDESAPPALADPWLTCIEPPDPVHLAERARSLGLSYEEARRIELWRLDPFELERVDVFGGVYSFHGHARDDSGDERLFCFAEVLDLGQHAPGRPDLARFQQRFHEAIEAMRSLQALRDPSHRLHWNRLYVFVRPPLVLTPSLVRMAVTRLAPETGNLGLERVLVRLAAVDAAAPDAPPRVLEVLGGNPTRSRVETQVRQPHAHPLRPATPYERKVASALARGLIYPYEVVRLLAGELEEHAGPGRATGPGSFQEHELANGALVPVQRAPGLNSCGVVVGLVSTPTLKHPEGMERVLVLGDPSFGMGSLAAAECDRIVAAIDLAEQRSLPLEWVALSSGARISLESGTENLDATARVVRRIVSFTDAGGEINLIVPGVNVGAQSYFNALATMGRHTRGTLIMIGAASMVLTGRAALEFSGGVSAEDEVGIGGYERIMGPSGQAQHQGRTLGDAYRILLEHYACAYRAPGERTPRRFPSADPEDRDISQFPYEGDEGFAQVGDLFSAAENAERKRPFSMRALMRALIDQDGGFLERWRDWVGAESAIVWDAHLGGFPVALVGIESRAVPRLGTVPNDGPDTWTAGTLFPLSSKKVARALNAASGVRPAVILANLSGFDGSPESMRRGILEYGAEIARAVVRFQGPLLFTVVSRYHGGACVVFSRELNPGMRALALEGSFASVIGGAAAAAVVFPRIVRRRANADPRVRAASARIASAADAASRVALRAELERVVSEVELEKQAEVAAEFDRVHTVERALQVGSLDAILAPGELRPRLVATLRELSKP